MALLALEFGLLDPLRERVRAGHADVRVVRRDDPARRPILDGRADQQTVGGLDVTVRRNAFGRQVDSFEEDLQFAGIDGPPLHAVFIRAPWVEEIGPGGGGPRARRGRTGRR